MAEINFKQGTSLNMIQVNVRGHLITIQENNPILNHSYLIQNTITNKRESFHPKYLDINPYLFHTLLSYFNQQTEPDNKNNQYIRELYKKKFMNNPEILAMMIYLEMEETFILNFIEH